MYMYLKSPNEYTICIYLVAIMLLLSMMKLLISSKKIQFELRKKGIITITK